MINNYSAFDFETSYGHIPCSIGIVEFENNEPVRQFYSLIKPIELKFNPINSRINKIHLEDVKDAPEFNDLWGEIENYFVNKPIVAHNASTDYTILIKTLSYYNLALPETEVFCTLNLSRKLYSLPNYKLDTVAKHLFIEDFKHHSAIEDAMACGRIFNKMMQEINFDINDSINNIDKNAKRPRTVKSYITNDLNESIRYSQRDGEQILKNLNFVITGVFRTLSREGAKDLIEAHGGKTSGSVSGKTDYLLAGEGMGPAKLQKAEALGVKVLSEDAFLAMICAEA